MHSRCLFILRRGCRRRGRGRCSVPTSNHALLIIHLFSELHFTSSYFLISPFPLVSPRLTFSRIRFQIFPSLNITNNPSIIDTTTDGTIVSHESGTVVYYPEIANSTTGGTGQLGNGTSAIYLAAITTNRTSLSYAGREVNVKWNLPGHVTGYDGRYKTASTAGTPKVCSTHSFPAPLCSCVINDDVRIGYCSMRSGSLSSMRHIHLSATST